MCKNKHRTSEFKRKFYTLQLKLKENYNSRNESLIITRSETLFSNG